MAAQYLDRSVQVIPCGEEVSQPADGVFLTGIGELAEAFLVTPIGQQVSQPATGAPASGVRVAAQYLDRSVQVIPCGEEVSQADGVFLTGIGELAEAFLVTPIGQQVSQPATGAPASGVRVAAQYLDRSVQVIPCGEELSQPTDGVFLTGIGELAEAFLVAPIGQQVSQSVGAAVLYFHDGNADLGRHFRIATSRVRSEESFGGIEVASLGQ